jgi:PKD repeat protein
VHTDTIGIGEYWVEVTITDTEIGGPGYVWTTSTFTVSLNRVAYANVSSYDNMSCSSGNITNRFQWGDKAWFNGTIGTTYPVTEVWVSIMVINSTNWFATLYNGSHDFNGNESLWSIAGGVLNYTAPNLGEYKLYISTNRTGVLNLTEITEGFTIKNYSVLIQQYIGGPTKYKYVTFFEWKLGQELTVDFTDRSTLEYPVQAVSWLWNFGDGTGATIYNTQHQYRMPGNYVVNYTVTFNNGDVYSYSTTIEVVDTAIGWWLYCAIGLLVFIGILGVGAWAIRKQSKKLAAAMMFILCAFIAISLIALQMFVA